MKKTILYSIVIFFSLSMLPLQAEIKSPIRFLYLGSIIVGAELINGIVQLLSRQRNTQSEDSLKLTQEEELKKQKELDKLLAPSKLLDIIEEETNISPLTNVVQTAPQQTAITNIQTSKEIILQPETRTQFSTYYITNYKTKEVYEFKKGYIDYYAVGVAYFNVNKKEKAKEFFLKTINLNLNKNQAINFLIENYNMSLKDINRQAKNYSEE